MSTVREFLAMGGYAPYVWSAYGLTAVLLLGNLWLAFRRERQILQELARELSRTSSVAQ
jgi:heme exporter protein D